MRRLDGISAFMVYNEAPKSFQHTLKIMIFDWSEEPGGYSFDRLLASTHAWLEMFPMLKWKLGRVPFGLNHPEWIQDQDFDPAHHLRRVACPSPGDRTAFNRLVSQLYANTLDQSRPLWLTWFVEGLEGGRMAMVSLFHHAYSDGAGAGVVLQSLVSNGHYTPMTSSDFGVDPHERRGPLRRLLRGLFDLPAIFAREGPLLVRMIRTERRVRAEFAAQGKALPPKATDAPDSPLNSVYSHGRQFSYATFPLAEISALARSCGVTINEGLVAMVAGALRRFFQASGHPVAHALVAGIPVNTRTETQKYDVVGNHVSNGFMWLPVHLDDPRRRLDDIVASSRAMKEFLRATDNAGVLRAAGLLPPLTATLMRWGLHHTRGQMKVLGNVGISNVRGPAQELRLGGIRVVDWLSIGQVTGGVGLNITGWSYVDKFNVCLMADQKVIRDGEQFAGLLHDAYQELRAMAADTAPVAATGEAS
jgi:diacylglycerol O-acyltransferase